MVGWEVGGCSCAILSAASLSTTTICIFYRQGCPALKFLSVQTQCKTTQTRCSIMAAKWYSTPSSTSLTISNAHIFSTSFRSFKTQHNWEKSPILFSVLYLPTDSPVERTHPWRSSQLMVQCPVLLSALQSPAVDPWERYLIFFALCHPCLFNKQHSNRNISPH